jgi:hypothetical protein
MPCSEASERRSASISRASAEAVQHHVRAQPGEGAGNAQSDAAGRSGDQGRFAFQHGSTASIGRRPMRRELSGGSVAAGVRLQR